MKRINIIKNDIVTNSANFQTQELADTWLDGEIDNGSFGKPERWVREGQEDISEATDTREVEEGEDTITEYLLPAEYTVETIDLGDSLDWAALRAARNVKLLACDWTQLEDSPVNKTAWAVYRQALRDLPENTEDPTDPTWPEEP